MYEFRIVVPQQRADEVENVLQGVAEVQREGVMPAPEQMASEEELAIASGSPLAILRIASPTLQGINELKSWLNQRWSEPYVDIRAQERSGAFSFSFRAHSAEEIKDWLENQATGKPLPEWTRHSES
ncbi:MAG: hypothetical protein ACM3US_12190 [Sphingomonadaceae bacterium]